MPLHRNPAPGVWKFTIFVDPWSVIITIYLVCLIHAWGKKMIFYRKNAFQLYDLSGHALAQKPLLRGS